jgi:hypothetical protein
MPLKSYRDVATSLRGSAFRRVSFDGRTHTLRAIPCWSYRGRSASRLSVFTTLRISAAR